MAFVPALPVRAAAAAPHIAAAQPLPRRARRQRVAVHPARASAGAGDESTDPPFFLRGFRNIGDGPTSGGSGNPSDGGDDASQQFEPFDGSVPLLPPWQPPTLEAAFSYRARGQSARDAAARAAGADRRLVRLESRGYATLYAHVVQDRVVRGSTDTDTDTDADNDSGDDANVRVWLRPLLLDDPAGGFVDVRGGTDLVLPRRCVADVVDAELRTRVAVNLAATEPDLPAGGLGEAARAALLAFVKRLGDDDGAGDGDEENGDDK